MTTTDQHGDQSGGPAPTGAGGWWMCACDRSLPTHRDTPPDPAGGAGCGMTYQLTDAGIAEHHITDHDEHTHGPLTPGLILTVQPGGFLRQDVPAGLAPSHHEATGENAMVKPHHPDRGGAPC